MQFFMKLLINSGTKGEDFRNKDHVKSCPLLYFGKKKAQQQELTAKLGCDATRIDFKR